MYPAAYPWRAHATPILRTGIALLIGTVVVLAFPGGASAGATDDYPIPHRAIEPTCTVSRSSPQQGIPRPSTTNATLSTCAIVRPTCSRGRSTVSIGSSR